MSSFNKDSIEYKELESREMTIQRVQQSVIDSIKLGFSESVPKSWYSPEANEIKEGDTIKEIERKTFNKTILANKKPYFFRYIYPRLDTMCQYYTNNWNENCIRSYKTSLSNVLKSKKEDMKKLAKKYYEDYPLDISDSLMNQICWRFEDEFDSYFRVKDNRSEFDYTTYKTDMEYPKVIYNRVKKVYDDYRNQVKSYIIKRTNTDNIDKKDMSEARVQFLEVFKKDAFVVCEDEEMLCNIVLDICYEGNNSPQFAWDICGDRIVQNLLLKNNNEILYFKKSLDGDVEFGGCNFTVNKRKVNYKKWEYQ